MIIDDGGGKGFSAVVNTDNRLTTQSVSQSEAMAEAYRGNVFQLTTGIVSLTTTASYTGLFYLKNTDTSKNIFVEIFRFGAGAIGEWLVTKNPTTGTLITNGTTMAAVNTRFDSGNVLGATTKKGSDAQTITDGTLFAAFPAQATFIELGGMVIITPNTSISVSFKPSVATTASVTAFVYQK